MVEGTASQGVAHASDRCIPCQEEGEKAEKSRGGEVGLDKVYAQPPTTGAP